MQTTKDKIFSYLPGILLFLIALIIGQATYQDYGISWDEPIQREFGNISYDYVFNGNNKLLTYSQAYYGVGIEMPLVALERWMKLTDTRDIFLMRHMVMHIFFLFSALCGYFLVLRLFKNKFLACLGFIMFAFIPRIYAHSFFNSKDVGFLSMFLIALNFSQYAFSKNKTWLYFVLGILCGYTTSIRIMGIMLGGFIGIFLVIDLITKYNYINKETIKKPLMNVLLYTVGFCFAVYIAWPYLWRNPIHNFIVGYQLMSHYDWDAATLLNGTYVKTTELPWTYFPSWFIITVPVLWLAAGVAGLWLIIRDFFRKASDFVNNKPERNFLLYFLCFLFPVLSIIALHSVVYDDWRHLYFVYPSFVLVGLYFFNKILTGMQVKYQAIVYGLCLVQIAMIGSFMIKYHPFQQVYFNELVSHGDESLRENYELEYWGTSFKQALDHLASINKTDTIRVACNYNDPCKNNLMILRPEDRKRVRIYDIAQMAQADYFITNFRGHPEDYPSKNIEYSVKVLNSTIMCVFKLEKKKIQVKK